MSGSSKGKRKRTPGLLSYRDLKEKGIPYSRQHIDRLEELGRFPARVKIGYANAWWEDQVDEWNRERERAAA